ncbi:MAG: hypothetical protein EA378_05210 [Phycisphaerales bacterium]|nr:MAG: hypothetical protein EA378_05210 [Phycisphaerales bacterium]
MRHHRRTRRTLAAPLAALTLSVGVLALAGCNILAPAFYVIHGPEKVRKLHELDPNRPTVVFVDDRANRVPRRALRGTIARSAEETLLQRRVLRNVIASNSAVQAVSADRYGSPMPIDEIARAVEAEVIIYATVDAFTLSPDGSTVEPAAQIRVKVIDAVSGQRVWPEDRNGQAVTIRIPQRPGYAPSTRNEAAQLEDELAARIGVGMAQIFFDHERQASARR